MAVARKPSARKPAAAASKAAPAKASARKVAPAKVAKPAPVKAPVVEVAAPAATPAAIPSRPVNKDGRAFVLRSLRVAEDTWWAAAARAKAEGHRGVASVVLAFLEEYAGGQYEAPVCSADGTALERTTRAQAVAFKVGAREYPFRCPRCGSLYDTKGQSLTAADKAADDAANAAVAQIRTERRGRQEPASVVMPTPVTEEPKPKARRTRKADASAKVEAQAEELKGAELAATPDSSPDFGAEAAPADEVAAKRASKKTTPAAKRSTRTRKAPAKPKQ